MLWIYYIIHNINIYFYTQIHFYHVSHKFFHCVLDILSLTFQRFSNALAIWAVPFDELALDLSHLWFQSMLVLKRQFQLTYGLKICPLITNTLSWVIKNINILIYHRAYGTVHYNSLKNVSIIFSSYSIIWTNYRKWMYFLFLFEIVYMCLYSLFLVLFTGTQQ